MRLPLALVAFGVAFSACMFVWSDSQPFAAVLLNGIVWVILVIASNLMVTVHYQDTRGEA